MTGNETPAYVTPRVLGRQWRDGDRAPFARMNADARVMEFFVGPLGRDASDAMVERASRAISERTWGMWAAETRADGRFIGFVGLTPVPAFVPYPSSPAAADAAHPSGPADAAAASGIEASTGEASEPRAVVEIGWRLDPDAWGRGLASEAAAAVLAIAFGRLQLPEVVAWTAVGNIRSMAVMQRLGMQMRLAAFEHPQIAAGHPHRTQCLWRIANPNAAATAAAGAQ